MKGKRSIIVLLVGWGSLILLAGLYSCSKDADGTGISPNWPKKAELPAEGRETAVSFVIGNKAYVGTGYNGTYLRDFWEFDPAANTWTQKNNFGGSARYRAIGFAAGGQGYIGLGYDGTYRSDLWKYDPVSNTWTSSVAMPVPGRVNASVFTIGNKAFIGMGYFYNGTVDTHYNDLWEFNVDSAKWTQKAMLPGQIRSMAFEFSIGNKGYVGGGYNKNVYLSDFYEYDPVTNVWTQRADFPELRSDAASFTLDGFGYVATGRDGDSYKKQAWAYDPSSNSWSKKVDFAGSARYRTVGFAINGKGYVGLGSSGSQYKNDLFEFWP